MTSWCWAPSSAKPSALSAPCAGSTSTRPSARALPHTDLIHKLGGPAMNGLYATMTVSTEPLPRRGSSQPIRFWANKYKTKFNEDPTVFSIYGYNAVDAFMARPRLAPTSAPTVYQGHGQHDVTHRHLRQPRDELHRHSSAWQRQPRLVAKSRTAAGRWCWTTRRRSAVGCARAYGIAGRPAGGSHLAVTCLQPYQA